MRVAATMSAGRLAAGFLAVAATAILLAVWSSVDEGPMERGGQTGAHGTAVVPAAADAASVAANDATAHGRPDARGTVRTASSLPAGYSVVRHRGRMVEGGTMARTRDAPQRGPDWLRAADGPERLAAAAAVSGRSWTFGHVELASAAGRASLEGSLRDAGARVVGSSGRLVRARLPGDVDALRDIAALPEVAGLGAVPPAAKLRGFDAGGGAESDAGLPVFVTVMEEDGDGEWGRRLDALGADVGDYDADTRAYTATATREVIGLLAESDFVAAVEPVRTVAALNDTAVPAMGADALLSRDFASPGAFTGVDGGSVAVGVMDTGLNRNHPDIASGRESICGTVLPWPEDREDELVEAEDLWIDLDGHGTHVTGTILGSGVDDPRFAGMAPGVPHIRFAKVLDRFGGGTATPSAAARTTSRGLRDAAGPARRKQNPTS